MRRGPEFHRGQRHAQGSQAGRSSQAYGNRRQTEDFARLDSVDQLRHHAEPHLPLDDQRWPDTLSASVSTRTSYTDTVVTSGVTYYYVVTAVNANGESPYSNQASAKAK